MKKVLLGLIIATSFASNAMADPYHHGGYYRGGYGWGWVAPAVIGGAVVYAATRPQTVVVQQPQVVYVPQPATVPYGYHYENILDANCNCYRTVLIPN